VVQDVVKVPMIDEQYSTGFQHRVELRDGDLVFLQSTWNRQDVTNQQQTVSETSSNPTSTPSPYQGVTTCFPVTVWTKLTFEVSCFNIFMVAVA